MRCIRILEYNIPTPGEKKSTPYGSMKIEHQNKTKTVKFGNLDGLGRNFITFIRKRYYFENIGTLECPEFRFDENPTCRPEREYA